MKIQNNGLQGTNPLETGKTQATPPTTGAGNLKGQTVSGHDGDTVQISGISQQLAESNALDGKQRESKVAALAAQYAKGQYQVNASALSQKLVSNSLSSGESGVK